MTSPTRAVVRDPPPSITGTPPSPGPESTDLSSALSRLEAADGADRAGELWTAAELAELHIAAADVVADLVDEVGGGRKAVDMPVGTQRRRSRLIASATRPAAARLNDSGILWPRPKESCGGDGRATASRPRTWPYCGLRAPSSGRWSRRALLWLPPSARAGGRLAGALAGASFVGAFLAGSFFTGAFLRQEPFAAALFAAGGAASGPVRPVLLFCHLLLLDRRDTRRSCPSCQQSVSLTGGATPHGGAGDQHRGPNDEWPQRNTVMLSRGNPRPAPRRYWAPSR